MSYSSAEEGVPNNQQHQLNDNYQHYQYTPSVYSPNQNKNNKSSSVASSNHHHGNNKDGKDTYNSFVCYCFTVNYILGIGVLG